MAARIRAFDWSKTPVGPAGSWSLALRMTLRILLANRFPHVLWWGPHYTQFYNDAYAPIAGSKHPDQALGRPASECWAEIWSVIGPLIDRTFHGGPPAWDEDLQLEVLRHGFLEESHFTIAYSPIPDDAVPSGIGGVIGTVHEITEQVLGERRLAVLRDLGARMTEARTGKDACAIAAHVLGGHGEDVPFALLYVPDPDGARASLAGAAGVRGGEEISPASIDLAGPQPDTWPLFAAGEGRPIQVVEGLAARFTRVPPGTWADPPDAAVVVPISSGNPQEIAAWMVAGVSARLRFDDAYRNFFNLVKTQIATGMASARAYEEERRRCEALAELDRAKTSFFSNVSHEFRTPLTLMLGPIEDMLRRPDSALSRRDEERLEIVGRNALRLLRLVNALLDFSRIEGGRVRARFRPTELGALTADFASVFRSACERAGLRLVVESPVLSRSAYVDQGMWEKVVLNLLSNAFKFTFEGTISVTLREVGDRVELEVQDTGTGIAAEEMPRLFERFHRVENARARTHEGSGIGLALVQELVKLHGGSVEARSAVGRGTSFVVTLPLGSAHLPPDQVAESREAGPAESAGALYVEEALRWLPDPPEDEGEGRVGACDEPPAATGRAPEAAARDRPRILVADDNADMRRYLVRLLADRFDVETAPDGRAALDAARRRRPDLVLSDVMMPRLDGFGLVREIRADAALREVPIILISARAGEESRVEGLAAGPDDYLVKPFSARELLARVEAHLKMAGLRRHHTEGFETLIDHAPFGVYLVDADLRVREVNRVAAPVFAPVPGGPIGRDFDEVAHALWEKRFADRLVALFRRTLETGESYTTVEPERFPSGCGLAYYEGHLDRITLPDGRHGAVCYFRDVSQQVDARQAIEESREALREADRKKDEFLATLSHELRNPLAPMRHALTLLQVKDPSGAELARAREVIDRQLSYLTRLVDDLLDVSRITRGKIVLRREPTDLGRLALEAIESCEATLSAARTAEVDLRLPARPVVVDGDRARLAQVFGNLMSNACKFTPPEGRIEVSVRLEGTEAVVSVRDTGIGIPADRLHAVFEMFAQLDGSRERARGGLGIGLTLVKQLVELHGGTIDARSGGVGRGSEFIVRLPADDGAARPEENEAHAGGERPEMTGRRILIVDDNPDTAESLALLFELSGGETHVAHDGREAVEKAERLRPDVVLLDIGLPKIDGYEACRKIRAHVPGKRPVIVALTGWGQDEDRRRSLEAGFDHHLVKPVTYAALARILADPAEDR